MKPDYTHSIINITASIVNHYGLTPLHGTLPELDAALKKDYDHVAVVLMDGLGTNLFDPHLEDQSVLRTHLKDTLTSVYPSTTVAATTAVLTGKTPYESGYLGWFQYFPEEDIHYQVFMNKDYYDESKSIPKDFFKKHFTQKTFLDLVDVKRKDVCTKKLFPAKIEENGYDSIEEGFKRLEKFQKSETRTLSYLYLVEPDLTQHKTGVKSIDTKEMVRTLDAALKTYKDSMPDNTLVILTADHGLTDVVPINLFDYHDLTATFKTLPANEPRMTNFFIKEDKREYFMRFFNDHFNDSYDLYTKREFLTRKLLGTGEKHENVDLTMGDFIAVAKDKHFFKLSDKKEHMAHHAGMTPDEMEVPLVVFDKPKKR